MESEILLQAMRCDSGRGWSKLEVKNDSPPTWGKTIRSGFRSHRLIDSDRVDNGIRKEGLTVCKIRLVLSRSCSS